MKEAVGNLIGLVWFAIWTTLKYNQSAHLDMNITTIKTEKGLVKKLRAIRDKMNEDMQDMSFEEMKAYFQKMRESASQQKSM